MTATADDGASLGYFITIIIIAIVSVRGSPGPAVVTRSHTYARAVLL